MIVVWDGLRPDLVVPGGNAYPRRNGQERHLGTQQLLCLSLVRRESTQRRWRPAVYPGRHGIVGNSLYVPEVDPHGAVVTGDDATLTAIAERDPPLVAVPGLGDYLAEAGKSVVVVSSGSPGSAWLSNPRPRDHLYNRALVRPAAAQAAVAQLGQVPPDSYPATGRLDWQARVCTEHVWPALAPRRDDLLADRPGPHAAPLRLGCSAVARGPPGLRRRLQPTAGVAGHARLAGPHQCHRHIRPRLHHPPAAARDRPRADAHHRRPQSGARIR